MAIDASIYGNIKQPQFDTPINALSQVLQLKQAQNQNRLADLQFANAERDQNDQNALNRAYQSAVKPDGSVDRTALYTNLAQGGQGAKISAIQKSFAEQDKSAAETQKTQVQVLKDANGLIGSAAYSLTKNPTPQNAQALIANLTQQLGPELSQKLGLKDLQIPNDPAQISQWAQSHYLKSLDTDKILSSDTSIKTTQMNNDTSRANNAATVGATIRGQNLEDARAKARLAYDQSQPKGQIVQSDNGPILVDPRTGTGKAVMGPDGQQLAGVTKPLNENQSKALLFGSRMRDADKILNSLAQEGTQTSIPGSRAPVIGGVITALSSDNRQMLDQAKRDFMTAVLRRESGAAISSGEFDTADKQYFPQPNDGPGVIAQKARNRKLAIQGILNEVPEKQRGALSTSDTSSSGVPDDIAALIKKHGGK